MLVADADAVVVVDARARDDGRAALGRLDAAEDVERERVGHRRGDAEHAAAVGRQRAQRHDGAGRRKERHLADGVAPRKKGAVRAGRGKGLPGKPLNPAAGRRPKGPRRDARAGDVEVGARHGGVAARPGEHLAQARKVEAARRRRRNRRHPQRVAKRVLVQALVGVGGRRLGVGVVQRPHHLHARVVRHARHRRNVGHQPRAQPVEALHHGKVGLRVRPDGPRGRPLGRVRAQRRRKGAELHVPREKLGRRRALKPANVVRPLEEDCARARAGGRRGERA